MTDLKLQRKVVRNSSLLLQTNKQKTHNISEQSRFLREKQCVNTLQNVNSLQVKHPQLKVKRNGKRNKRVASLTRTEAQRVSGRAAAAVPGCASFYKLLGAAWLVMPQ